ncbi:MAG: pre-peptidase C-terminal domain-containing protein [Waterburya sp.]
MSDIQLDSSNNSETSQSGDSLQSENQNSSDTSVSSSDATINAGVISDNYAVVDSFESGSSEDVFQFEIGEADNYSFSLDNLAADLDLTIRDNAGNTLYSSAETGNTTESIAAELQPGSYSASVTAKADVSTDYNFSITQSSDDDGSSSSDEGETVYKFFRTDTQTEFYTTDEAERDNIQANLTQYEYQGELFTGAPNPESDDITGVEPVYRFFNNTTGVHLYTSDEAERDYVTNNLSNYTSEGVSYYGYESQAEGTVPLYRLYNTELDAHFYTPSAEEKDAFLANSNYQLEGGEDGIAFYVQPIDDIA